MKMYELFYPSDLKKHVKELRQKGDLNEHALKHLNSSIQFQLLTFFGITIIIILGLFSNEPGVEKLSLLFFPPLLVWASVKEDYKKHYFAYLEGEKRRALVVNKRVRNNRHDTVEFHCETIGGREEIGTRPYFTSTYPYLLDSPNEGDEIYIFEDPSFKHGAMLDEKGLKQRYCLPKHLV